MRAVSSCGERGLLSTVVHGVVSRATLRGGARVSHCSGFSCYRAQALGARASVVAARGFSSYGSQAIEYGLRSCGTWLSCSVTCGISPDR